MDNLDNFMDSEIVKQVMREAKWALLLGVIKDHDICQKHGMDPSVSDTMYEFLKVFYKAGVDPDVVIEALEKITPTKASNAETKFDISEKELTDFVSVLDKIRKKGDDDVRDKKEEE